MLSETLQMVLSEIALMEIALVVLGFSFLTLFETLLPGPTLALVLETRASASTENASRTVWGITLANLLWVVAAMVILYLPSYISWSELETYLLVGGAAYLSYLAARRLLAAMVFSLTRQAEDPSMNDPKIPAKAARYFLAGFISHGANPLTAAYYLGTFNVAAIKGGFALACVFGLIAVATDLAIYRAIAVSHSTKFDSTLKTPIFRLLTAGLLTFFVVSLISRSDKLDFSVALVIVMAALWYAAIMEARRSVQMRSGLENAELWAVARLWGAWFTLYALIGAIYVMVNGVGLGQSALGFDSDTELQLRAVFLISGILGTSIVMAAIYGTLRDMVFDRIEPGTGIQLTIWQASFGWSALGAICILAIFFLLLVLSGFGAPAPGL